MGEVESCATVYFSLSPNAASVLLNDPLYSCKTDTCAFKFTGTMKTLKQTPLVSPYERASNREFMLSQLCRR
jgi:hypothetical protein